MKLAAVNPSIDELFAREVCTVTQLFSPFLLAGFSIVTAS